VSVTVAGEVNSPGVKQATGLSTPLDALVLALGVKKSGSLRNIRIVRGGRIIPYDLYHVLLNDGSAPQVLLQDGDRIVVPTLGKVAAVSGWVRRPGIYELRPGQDAISLQELLRLGGGLQVRGNFRYALQTSAPNPGPRRRTAVRL
jgi:protein involved in polysaccharide export with SLBB domain